MHKFSPGLHLLAQELIFQFLEKEKDLISIRKIDKHIGKLMTKAEVR